MRGHQDARAGLCAVEMRDDILNVAAVAIFIARETGLNGGLIPEIFQFGEHARADDVILLSAAGMRNAVADQTPENFARAIGGKLGGWGCDWFGRRRPRSVKQQQEDRSEDADDEQRTSSRPLVFLGQPILRVGDTIGCESAQVNKTAVLRLRQRRTGYVRRQRTVVLPVRAFLILFGRGSGGDL
jgi:hypothetical protein